MSSLLVNKIIKVIKIALLENCMDNDCSPYNKFRRCLLSGKLYLSHPAFGYNSYQVLQKLC